MLVLSYPKKNILLSLAVTIAACLFAPTTAKAQAQAATINPDGGNTPTDGLRITITDTAILVRRNGIDQYNLSDTIPRHDRGLKTYVILQQKWGTNTIKQPTYLQACDISGVHGDGTAASPWKVATHTTLNNPTGGIYNLTTIYSYVNGNDYYLVDFYISAHERYLSALDEGGPYYMHIYFSERSWMNNSDTARALADDWVSCTTDMYYDDEVDFTMTPPWNLPQLVGAECGSGDCPGGFIGGHYFKTKGGFTSYKVGAPQGRDTKPDPGYELESQITSIIQSMGVAVHKTLEVDAVNLGKTRNLTKRFIIGFDRAEIAALDLPEPSLILSDNYGQTSAPDSSKVTIELSSAVSSGPEGEVTHPLEGLTLTVSGGMFNAPQIAYLRVVTTGTGTGHAAPGPDYQELYTHVIIPAESYFTPVQIPLNNILIKGDAIENPDKTLTVELLPTCAPYMKLGSVQSSAYTIVDDDEHKIFVEAAQPTLDEGQTMKVKVRMTGELLAVPVTVNLSKGGTSEAEDEDHSPIPPTVTIPAGALEVEFDLEAVGDRVLEPDETLEINATAVFGAETKTAADTIQIIDTTRNNAANKVIHFITQNAPETTPVTFTASLPAGVSTELPVDITMPLALSPGSVASSGDFNTIFPATVTIGAFGSSVDFTVTAKADSRIEPDEIAYFDATATGFTVQQGSFYVIDNQANKQITITFDASEVSEGGMVTGTVTLPYLTSYALELDLLRDPSSVAEDDDFSFQDTKVTFVPNTIDATFVIDINSDLWLELDELLAIGGTYKDFTIVPGTVTIKDETKNQPGLCDFTIEPQGVDVLEGNSINVKVKLAPGVQSTEPITIDLSAFGPDAADYTMPLSITIDPGENEATFVLTAEPDLIIEPAEQLQITGMADIAGYSAVQAAVIDILDATGNDPDNRKITVNTPLSVTEGGNLALTFSLPSGVTTFDAISIDVAITQTGAGYADNADFAGGVPFVLTIPAGGNQVTWTVSPVLDGVTEGTEHLVLQATTSTGFTVNDNNPVDVEVLDNNAPNPNTTIVFTAAQTTMTEGGSLVEVTAALQAGTAPSPITITLDKLSGTTASDGDFFVTPASIVIPQGQSSVTFYISANIDAYLEKREELNLGGIAAGYTFQGTLLYIDDANSKQITLTLDDPSTTPFVEENSTLALRVKLNDGVIASENITVQLDRGAGSVVSLLATEYAFPATVTIPAGGNHISFNLEAKPDNVIEPLDERLEITAAADVFGVTSVSAMNIDIMDATGLNPANKIITVAGPATVTEGGAVTYTFSLPSGITSAQDIVISLAAGTATPATEDADFDPVIPASVTIPAGADHVDLIIEAAADGIIEETEKLRRNPSSAGYTFAGNISLDVMDNDMTGAAIVITSNANVTEGNAATITATLQGGLTAGTSIVVALSKGASSTTDNTDHGTLTNITILPGSSSGTTSLTTALDDLLESPETVIIEGHASGFTVTGTTTTIDDKNGADAANKIFTVTPEATSVAEGSGTKVWIRLPSPQKTQGALTITLQRGGATSATLLGSEYNFPATVTIPAGGSEVSFDLDAQTDNVIEPVEELEVEASAMVYGTSITASNKINITDANNKTISITGPAGVTEGGTATITFSLPAGITTAEAITIGLAPGAATPATTAADFNPALPATVTIPAGGDHVDLQVSPVTDGLLEPTEKLHLLPSASGYTFGSDVRLDILDNDHTGATIALSASQASIAEGGTATTITATLLGGLTAGSDITITLNRGTGSTALSTDHSALNTITISTGNTTGNTTITAASDNILEGNETLILEGTATGFAVTGTTVTITDATVPKQITLTPEAVTVTEGNTIKVWVRLPAGITTSENITVQLDRGASSVAGASEYTFPATVTIPENGSEISFDVHANTDNVIEPNELLEITAEADVFGTTATANTSVNIIDATGNKTISIATPASVTEGGTATITFSLPAGITTAEAITIVFAPGTATPATTAADFNPALPATVTIPAGGDHVDLQVSPVTDGLLEPTEKLHLLPSASGYTFGSDVTLDILDNDHTGATIALSASQVSITEGGTATTITATLLGGLTAGSNITITLNSGTGSTALSTDHSALNTITISTGNTTGNTTITAASDNILEGNETLILEGTATGFAVTGTTVTITDASGPKQIMLTPEATTVTEGNTIKVWVRLPAGITTSENITVQLDRGAASVAGVLEYTFPATVTIPANGNEISFDVHANTDNVIEPNELLEITAEADIFGTTATANTSVNIIDATGNKTISITGPASVTEGSSATITFSLPTGITTAEAITISLAPGTATPATIAADFNSALPATMTIPAGGDHIDLQVSPITDGLLEPTEKLHLIPSVNGYTFGSDLTLDVIDNDHTGATIALSASQASIAEGGTATTITATLLGGLTAGSNITIMLNSATGSSALSTDHSVLNTITINSGNTTGSTTITATSDNIFERSETLILEGTTTGFTVTGTTVTITDASGPKQITLTPEAATVTEGNTIKVWVRLPAGITTSENITVQLDRGATSVAGASEYTFPATVTIPANNSEVFFSLGANTDNVIEPNELLEITAEADVFGTTATANTSVNIIDATGNKTINITGPTSVTEGSSATITFSLPAGITAAQAITINLAAGTSTVDVNDITGGIPVQVTIPAGSNAGTLQIDAITDGIIEPTEKLHLIPSASGYTFGSDVRLDILDNDHTGATIALSASQASIAEGGTATTITATLLGGLTAASNITITVNRAAGSTASGTDYSTLNAITISTGNTTGSTTITATSDNILERDESLILEGTATGFTVTGTTVTITDASGPKQITLTPEATTVTEGNTIKVWVRLPAGITTSENITVQLDRSSNTVATASDYTFPATVTIPPNNSEVFFNLGANTDNVIEPNELLEITAEAGIFGTTATTNASVNIIDATGNKTISITGPASVTEGGTATITFSLPAGIITAQAITINLAPGTSTVDANDITGGIPAQVIIPAGTNAGALVINVNTDNIIEPAEKLHLLPSATGFTFSEDLLIDVLDANHSGTISITGPASLTEGNTATFTVSLSGALLAGSDVPVSLSRSTSSTSAVSDHSTVPAIVTIKAGEHATSFTITASTDNILEATESLVMEGTAAAYSVDAATLQIKDATSLNPANTVITLSPAASTILEGNTAQFFVSLPAGIVSSVPVQVNMSKTAATSTAADTDHTQIPADITIPAMSNKSADFNISAVADGIIEPQEILKVDGTVPAGLSFAGTVIHIDDATGLNPANRQITITIDSTILHEGSTSKVTFALPAGITTATAISITVAPHADYTLTPVVIVAGNNKTEATLEAIQDNVQEATEIINLTATATGFTFVPGTVTIPGDAAPALSVTALKMTDAAEPSTHGTFTLQLANGATAPADITVMYTIAGTATGGTDYTTLSGQAIIRVGTNSIAIPVTVQNDQLVEGTETIQLTLQSASYFFLGNPVACAVDNNSVTMNIADNAGYDRSVRIEKIADAAEPNTQGRLKVRFNSNITAIAPVTVTYVVTGTATAGTDYTALPGAVTIPAGQQEAVIAVNLLDDQQREGDETVIVKLTGTSFTIPGITWPLATQQEATVILKDNDVVTMEVFAADEAAEGAVLPVILRASQPSPVDIQVTVTLQHDAARTVSPTVPRSGTTLTVTLPANQTEVSFDMSLEDNETNDDDGFVNLLIEPQTSGAQPYGKGASGNTATRVTDDDPLDITFKKDTVRIMEGHSGTTSMPFTVVLSRRSTRAITLSYEFGDAFEGAGADRDPQRANRGEDYHALITSIVIPPLQEEADIVVPVFGDVGAEEDEYFALKLKGAMVASGQNIPVMGIRSVAIGGIMNDDMAIDMEIRISKALSPNGDGRNDVLTIENIEKYPRNEIVILNRWGGTIFKTSNYNNQSNNFNGRSNAGGGAGNDLPDGSYFYILHVWDGNGKMQRHTGYLVLKYAN